MQSGSEGLPVGRIVPVTGLIFYKTAMDRGVNDSSRNDAWKMLTRLQSLSFRAAGIISSGLEPPWILGMWVARLASRPGIHVRKRFDAWSFGNSCSCRRGFRVGFGTRACVFCRVRNGFKRSAKLEAARNDRWGAESW